MPKVIYAPQALRDLQRIADYIAKDNYSAAQQWLANSRDICDLLATQPEMGEFIQTRRSGELRRHASGVYLFYFRPLRDGVQIVRIIHGARDQSRLIG